MKLKFRAFFILIAVFTCAALHADYLFLNNGSYIEGKVTSENPNNYSIKKVDNKIQVVPVTTVKRALYITTPLEKQIVVLVSGLELQGYHIGDSTDKLIFTAELNKLEEIYIKRDTVAFITGMKPTNLIGITSENSITLSWTPPYKTPRMYRIYDKKDDGKYKLLTEINRPEFTVKSLDKNKSYTYAVTSVHSRGYESGYSNELTLRTEKPPAPPEGIKSEIHVNTDEFIQKTVITWEAPASNNGKDKPIVYYVYMMKDGYYSLIGSTNEKKISVDELPLGSIRYFGVRAVDERNRFSHLSDNTSTKDIGPEISVEPIMLFPFGDAASILNTGYGVQLRMDAVKYIFDTLDLGMTMSYLNFTGRMPIYQSATIVPFTALIGYKIEIFQHFFINPSLQLGGAWSMLNYDPEGVDSESPSYATKSVIEPYGSFSLAYKWEPIYGLSFYINTAVPVIMELKSQIYFFQTGIGVTWRF